MAKPKRPMTAYEKKDTTMTLASLAIGIVVGVGLYFVFSSGMFSSIGGLCVAAIMYNMMRTEAAKTGMIKAGTATDK